MSTSFRYTLAISYQVYGPADNPWVYPSLLTEGFHFSLATYICKLGSSAV